VQKDKRTTKLWYFKWMNYGLLLAKKTKKRWTSIAYDPWHRLVIAHHIGRRRKQAAKKLWKKIPGDLKNCIFETDDYSVKFVRIVGRLIDLFYPENSTK
jgi:IS1 family transposase